MKKSEKFAVGIVVSKNGLWGLKSWKPVAVEITIAEAEALSSVLAIIAGTYIAESRREQILLQEFRKIRKEKPKK
jgi:hypothetical protein